MSSRLMCALVGATLLPCSALAGVLIPQEPGARPLVLRKQRIQVEVNDQVARATVDEVFENLTDQALEGSYVLPLPAGAAISGFATWVAIKVSDQKRISRLEVLSHPAKLEQLSSGGYRVSLFGKDVSPGKELVLSYRTESFCTPATDPPTARS